MHIVKAGNKYINMDRVVYIEYLDVLGTYLIYFDMENDDATIVLDNENEVKSMTDWLSRNSEAQS